MRRDKRVCISSTSPSFTVCFALHDLTHQCIIFLSFLWNLFFFFLSFYISTYQRVDPIHFTELRSHTSHFYIIPQSL